MSDKLLAVKDNGLSGLAIQRLEAADAKTMLDVPAVDDTLAVSGAAADAKATGEETSNIKSIIGSGAAAFEKHNGYPDGSTWNVSASTRHIVIPCNPGDTITITANSGHNTPIAMLQTYSVPSNGDTVDYSDDPSWGALVSVGTSKTEVYTVPSDAYFLMVYCGTNSPAFDNRMPDSIAINGYNYMETLTGNISFQNAKTEYVDNSINAEIDNLRKASYVPATTEGNISYSNGTDTSSSNRRRSGIVKDNFGTVYSIMSDGLFAIFAYQKSNGVYVGVLKDESDVISFGVPADNNNVVWSKSLDFNSFRAIYPLYNFRFLYRRGNGATPVVDEILVTNLLRESEIDRMKPTIDASGYFESGAINASTGVNTASSSRFRTVQYIGDDVCGLRSSSADGYFYLYAYNSSGYVGMYTVASDSFTTSGSMLKTISLDEFRAKYPDYKFRIVYRTYSSGTPETPSISQIVLTNADYKNTPITIRVMQFNIGRFDYGVKDEGLTEEEYQEKLPGYKRLFANYQPGILGLEEWEPYMDAAHLHESDAVLFDPTFPYSWHNDHTAIKTIYPIMYSTHGVLTPDLESSYKVAYTLCEYMVNGKKVGVISAALKMGPKSGDTPEQVIPIRAAQLAYEMELLSGYEYAIICNDLNCQTDTERDAMKAQIAAAGFTIANGGYFPDEITHSSQLHDYYIDNILTKGMTLRNFKVLSNEYSNLSSDHYAVIADYVI